MNFACVNGSYSLVPMERIEAYMAIEKRAVEFYREVIFSLFDQGTDIYTHKTFGQRFLERQPPIKYTIIRHQYGYDRTQQHLRGRGLGMGSACLMSLVVAKEYQPSKIHLIGCEGYALDNIHADGNDTHPDLKNPDEKTCRVSNECASLHFAHITHMFPNTEFIFYGGLNHPNRENWRATFVTSAGI